MTKGVYFGTLGVPKWRDITLRWLKIEQRPLESKMPRQHRESVQVNDKKDILCITTCKYQKEETPETTLALSFPAVSSSSQSSEASLEKVIQLSSHTTMSFGDIVLNYGDSLIRESEIDILKTNQWLNDAVIGFYFEYLGNQAKSHEPQEVELYGPGVTQLLKLIPSSEELKGILGDGVEKIEYAFWPVNDSTDTEKQSSGSHWSLLVFSRTDNKFMHFDSYGGSNEPDARMLYKNLSPLFSSTSTFHDFEGCCHQTNGRDCGLHVILNAELIIDFIHKSSLSGTPSLWKNGLSTATPKQAESKRNQLLELIASLSKHRK